MRPLPISARQNATHVRSAELEFVVDQKGPPARWKRCRPPVFAGYLGTVFLPLKIDRYHTAIQMVWIALIPTSGIWPSPRYQVIMLRFFCVQSTLFAYAACFAETPFSCSSTPKSHPAQG